MRKSLILFVALFIGATQIADAQKNDPKAKAILDAVSKKITSLKSFKANFSLSLAGAGGKMQDTKKGTIFLKGKKYRVSLPGQEIINDNKTVWTYLKDMNEVQISSFNPNEQTMSPAKFFTNFYDKEYNYKYAGTKKVNGKNCEVVELVPTDKTKQFSKVELAVDKSTNTIVGGNIWEKNGNNYKYDISGFTPNATVSDATFTFDAKKHPGVEVVDLR